MGLFLKRHRPKLASPVSSVVPGFLKNIPCARIFNATGNADRRGTSGLYVNGKHNCEGAIYKRSRRNYQTKRFLNILYMSIELLVYRFWRKHNSINSLECVILTYID